MSDPSMIMADSTANKNSNNTHAADDTDIIITVKQEQIVLPNGWRGVYEGQVLEIPNDDDDDGGGGVNVNHKRGCLRLPHGQGVMLYETTTTAAGPAAAKASSSTSASEKSTPTVAPSAGAIPVKYQGEWEAGEWEGYGTVLLSSGDAYTGSFHRGVFSGKGHYTWLDGREYQGEYLHGKRHGEGLYKWKPTGAAYSGQFRHNTRHGKGTYQDPTNAIEYTGDWKAGAYHGYGIYQWKDAAGEKHVYRGNFVNGVPHGQGIEILPTGSVRHDGLWRKGVPVPHGTSLDEAEQQQQHYMATSSRPYAMGITAANTNNTATGKKPPQPTTTVVNNHHWPNALPGCDALYRGIWDLRLQAPNGNGTADFLSGEVRSYEGCFKDGKFHGQGRLLFLNGDSFEGDFVDGQRHGTGCYTWRDGRQYKGDFIDSEREGKGILLYPNSDMYEGEFRTSKREGQGRFVFADGSVYEGGWKAGEYDGEGTLVHSDGRTYVGSWKRGRAHGHGKELNSQGKVTYEGEWILGLTKLQVEQERKRQSRTVAPHEGETDGVAFDKKQRSLASTTEISIQEESRSSQIASSDTTTQARIDNNAREAVVDEEVYDSQGNAGKYTGLVCIFTRRPHGVGRLVYTDGNRIHEGFWNQGSKEGHGRCLFFPQGDFHEGEYRNNVRHGPGRYHWNDGRRFVGHYADDLRSGEGVFTYPSGERYEGNFELGQRSGKGRFVFDNGKSYYDGEWKSGKYHGAGRLVWGNGCVYEGEFQDGTFHGKGVKKDPDGEIIEEGVWVEGRFQSDDGETEKLNPSILPSTSSVAEYESDDGFFSGEEHDDDSVASSTPDYDNLDATPSLQDDGDLPPKASTVLDGTESLADSVKALSVGDVSKASVETVEVQ